MKLFILTFLVAGVVFAANTEPESQAAKAAQPLAAPQVKYKSGKEINFEELLIQGQLKRPELSVVTGDASGAGDGLVRLRENFVDKMTAAAGEENP